MNKEKPYNKDNWNCYSLLLEYYPQLSIDKKYKSVRENKRSFQEGIQELQDVIEEIPEPEEKCAVLMNGYHVGVFINNKVIHNDINQGTATEPLYKLRYKYNVIQYYRIHDKATNDNS